MCCSGHHSMVRTREISMVSTEEILHGMEVFNYKERYDRQDCFQSTGGCRMIHRRFVKLG